MPTWDARQYLQFADERTQPCRDLIARVGLESPARIIDLGCGPGNSTEALVRRWPGAKVSGMDSSPAMIAAAREKYPEQEWSVGDIASWTASPACDLVFSNAALQWVPNHAAVFPHLARQVAPGGALAVQVPANIGAPAHQFMRDLAASATWRGYFPQAVREWFVDGPAFYYDALSPVAREIDLWTTEYLHIMAGPEAIVEWYKGTGLRPFLDALPESERERFLADYLALIAAEYPRQADGRVLFPFLRLFVIAYV